MCIFFWTWWHSSDTLWLPFILNSFPHLLARQLYFFLFSLFETVFVSLLFCLIERKLYGHWKFGDFLCFHNKLNSKPNLFLLFAGENDVGTGEECCNGSEHLTDGDSCSICQQQQNQPNQLSGGGIAGVHHKPSHSISGTIVSQPSTNNNNQRPPAIRSNSSSSSLFTVGSSSPGREEHQQQHQQKELRLSTVSLLACANQGTHLFPKRPICFLYFLQLLWQKSAEKWGSAERVTVSILHVSISSVDDGQYGHDSPHPQTLFPLFTVL